MTTKTSRQPKRTPLPAPKLLALRSLNLTLDRKRQGKSPAKTARAQREYERSLRGVARHVGELINGFEPGDISMLPSLQQLLARYAEALTPWAERTASSMLAEVNARDRETWRSLGNLISTGLRQEILHTPVGETLRSLLGEQVALITSLPIEAGQRVHELTLKGLEDSTRAREIAREINRSGEVTESRATLIARTEISRTASVLTQSRAEHVGSTHYVWRTAKDMDVRPGHKAMEGTACEWAHPPAINENGRTMHFHPGQIWNCRCWPEPIIPDFR